MHIGVAPLIIKMSSKVKLQRSIREQQVIVTVIPDTKEGRKCFNVLQEVANELDYVIERIAFEKLDFGETDALDKFYSSNVAVADVTDRACQAKLFYHLGLRESFEMKQNIVTYLESGTSSGLRGGAFNVRNSGGLCV